MTMILDNNFLKYDNATIILLSFDELNSSSITDYIRNITIDSKNHSIIFITDVPNVNYIQKNYNLLKNINHNYKIILQIGNKVKSTIISTEISKYKYAQLINRN